MKSPGPPGAFFIPSNTHAIRRRSNHCSSGRPRRARRGELSPREVRAVRRAGRRRRRQRGGHLPGRHRGHQHARGLPLSPDLPRAQRDARRRSGLHRRGRHGSRSCRPDRHRNRRCRHRRATGRRDRLRPAAPGRQRRQGRLGQYEVQEQHQSDAAQGHARSAGREAPAAPRAEGDGRRGPARPTECRKIDADPRRFGGEAERLPTIPSRRYTPIWVWSRSGSIAAS